MRVYFIVDETPNFHPEFIAALLRRLNDEVVGAARVTRVPPKSDLTRHLMRNWYRLRWLEMVGLVWHNYGAMLWGLFARMVGLQAFGSVRGAFRAYGITPLDVEYDINQRSYIDAIRAAAPDVIISSNSLLFEEELLSIPTRCIINRHSSLLPAYGGLWPVLHAYRRGERETGVSVHVMRREIDTGPVLAQRAVPITPGESLFSIYRRCFEVSVDVVLEALDRIRRDDVTPIDSGHDKSYYSFPTIEDWKEFRMRGGRFI